jgi:hypothetical protein
MASHPRQLGSRVEGDGRRLRRAAWLVAFALAGGVAGVVPRDASAGGATGTLVVAGERKGIHLYPPPGTKPVMRGIVVPEDFALPDGYVRHYQTTDDGKRLPAILMFRPGYVPVDAEGRPVTVPESRIVPPELAPPGMPIEMLDVPAAPASPGATP